jgi:hypothetical protein
MTDLVDALLIPVAGTLIIPAGLAAILWTAARVTAWLASLDVEKPETEAT